MSRHFLAILILPILYLPCYLSNDILERTTVEDGLYESLGAISLLLAAISFMILYWNPRLYSNNNNPTNSPAKWYFLFLALIFIFAFGEEISWGQRIFNFATPEAFKKYNVQNEFNVHNLEIFHGKTRDGEDKTGLKALFTMHRLFYLGLLIYLLIVPLLTRLSARFCVLIQKVKLPVPHLLLGILFAFNLIYGNVLRAISSNLDGHGIVEIKETVIALILLALPWYWIDISQLSGSKTRS